MTLKTTRLRTGSDFLDWQILFYFCQFVKKILEKEYSLTNSLFLGKKKKNRQKSHS